MIGSVLYSFPVAFLMLLDVLKYEDGTAYEAAAVLGISKGRQIRSLLLPYLRKPLISVIFATFTPVSYTHLPSANCFYCRAFRH